MGLKLVSFLDLGDTAPWLEQLNHLSVVDLTDDDIRAAFLEKGFSTEGVLRQLTAFYQPREFTCS